MRFALSALLLCACTETLAPPTDQVAPDEDGVVLQPETVLMDQVAGIEDVVVEHDTVTLWTDGSEIPVQVGSVVIGERGGGYLRKVDRVDVDGRRVVLTTRPAKLTDAVAQGHVKTNVVLGTERTDGPKVFDFGGRVLMDEMLWSDAENGYIDFTLMTGEGAHATWTPDIEYDIDVGLTHVDASFDGKFDLDYEADFIATLSGAYDEDFELQLYTQTFPFRFMMGQVPVWGTATVDLYAGFDVDLEGSVTQVTHTEAHAWAEVSAAFSDAWGPNNRTWDTSFDAGIEGDENGDYLSFSTQLEADGYARVHVRADVTLELYNSAGAVVSMEPWIRGDFCDEALDLSITSGVAGSHQYYFEAIGWTLYESDPLPFEIGPWGLRECSSEEG